MRTSIVNFQPITNTQTKIWKSQNNNTTNTPKSDISFKGCEEDTLTYFTLNLAQVFQHSEFLLHGLLLKDGFSEESIEQWNIYSTIEEKSDRNTDVLSENYDIFASKGGNIDLLIGSPKSNEDIGAMFRTYQQLKEKFVTEDIEKYSKAFLPIDEVLKQDFGIDVPEDKAIKDLELRILRYTNKYNEPITRALLDNEDFNNINIPQAIKDIQSPEKAQAAQSIINAAKAKNCSKKMSLPIAVMIKEANFRNLPIIYKALHEQEFLENRKDFVSSKLPNFLKTFDYVVIAYLKDRNMTLQDVEDLINFEQQANDMFVS